ncbi:nitroreductase family protein [Thalassovita sp.]|uniref:nitroreductase family protein n=1 Tax=Thalassovita sp. TaxID=1979401 RepID=UPI0029DE5984|nr:nitroreductase family protein [Thalassovita sp.]
MPERNQAALDFLLTRRSRPQKTLTTPVPSRTELMPILTAALRTPDHGKLEPWRLIVLERAALLRLGALARARAEAAGLDPDKAAKDALQYDTGHLAVAVVEIQKDSDKVPPIEQTYSAGAVCLSLLNAALAAGWGANWLSGWAAHDRAFAQQGLGLAANERIAGLIHIGTETSAPPERPRPDMDTVVTWQSE